MKDASPVQATLMDPLLFDIQFSAVLFILAVPTAILYFCPKRRVLM